MKKLVFIIAAVLSLNANAQQVNDKGLYVNSEGELFTGTISSQNGDVKLKAQVKEGVLEGSADYFYASGNLMESGIFKNGKKDAKWTRFSENGTISAIGFYSLGKKTNTWFVYDANGKKRFEMNYSDGEKTGTWTNWDENGMVVNTKNYSINN